ncbi:MAG: type II toxin-antitoxin system RelE/ParE family toxin [Caldilineaceae bacterium]
MYALRWHLQTKKQLRLVPTWVERDIAENILDLKDEPYPPGAEELRDHFSGTWKLKVDGWRIFYAVDEARQIVNILAVKRRTPNTYTHLYD